MGDRKCPEGEKEELRQIYSENGFRGPLLEQVVDVLTSYKKKWDDTMRSSTSSVNANRL